MWPRPGRAYIRSMGVDGRGMADRYEVPRGESRYHAVSYSIRLGLPFELAGSAELYNGCRHSFTSSFYTTRCLHREAKVASQEDISLFSFFSGMKIFLAIQFDGIALSMVVSYISFFVDAISHSYSLCHSGTRGQTDVLGIYQFTFQTILQEWYLGQLTLGFV